MINDKINWCDNWIDSRFPYAHTHTHAKESTHNSVHIFAPNAERATAKQPKIEKSSASIMTFWWHLFAFSNILPFRFRTPQRLLNLFFFFNLFRRDVCSSHVCVRKSAFAHTHSAQCVFHDRFFSLLCFHFSFDDCFFFLLDEIFKVPFLSVSSVFVFCSFSFISMALLESTKSLLILKSKNMHT